MTLELPGLAQDEVTLTVDDNVLVVSGEKKPDHNINDRSCRALERSGFASRGAPFFGRHVCRVLHVAPRSQANAALDDLRDGAILGAAVLVP